MKNRQSTLLQIFQPYLFISIAGLLAFAPVSFMLRALKNDIIALEYPINHFISQCVHNGEIPYWFNTWGMGFPLQSNLTWGIYSTPQLIFSSIFNYNIYVLHIEFMFFVLLAGWSMFHLLFKYFVTDKWIAQLLAISYMLSGFVVGSTQWLLYITAASFIPLVISSLLKVLNNPSSKNALQFAIVYSLMFTSVYAAFNIITTYSLIIFLLLWLLQSGNRKKLNFKVLRYIAVTGMLTALLCLPCLYYTIELLKHIERGNAITTNTAFFNSNYLHPSALSSIIFPFSSVKMNFSNTEGTMLNSYTGIIIVLLFPSVVWQIINDKKKSVFSLLAAALLFLLISFGEVTPVRNILNLLPGFSYFRNPAIFRLYFILLLIFFIGKAIQNKSFSELFSFKNSQAGNIIYYTIQALSLICLIIFLFHLKDILTLQGESITSVIKNITYNQTVLINSFIQLLILLSLLLSLRKRWFIVSKFIFTIDLIVNTLICTPFFSVSSYTIPEVTRILHTIPGFPLQSIKISDATATFTDNKNNTWNNVNIFNKQVSSNQSYRGPLTLMEYYRKPADSTNQKKIFDNPLAFIENGFPSASMQLLLQKPTHIRVSVKSNVQTLVTVLQNHYPGWKAWYNNNRIEIIHNDKPGMTVAVPKGNGIIDFRYERKWIWITALFLHLITISFIIWKSIFFIKTFKLKLSSLS